MKPAPHKSDSLTARVLGAMPQSLQMAAALLSPDEQEAAVLLFAKRSAMTVEKLAMLMQLEANRYAGTSFTNAEEAELRGINRDTVGEMKRREELPRVLGR